VNFARVPIRCRTPAENTTESYQFLLFYSSVCAIFPAEQEGNYYSRGEYRSFLEITQRGFFQRE